MQDFPINAVLLWLNCSDGDVLHGFKNKSLPSSQLGLFEMRDCKAELIHLNTVLTELES